MTFTLPLSEQQIDMLKHFSRPRFIANHDHLDMLPLLQHSRRSRRLFPLHKYHFVDINNNAEIFVIFGRKCHY